MTPITIRAGDTRIIEIPVDPASALEGTRVRARLWLGTITSPTWVHTWDTLDGQGIEIVGQWVRLSTGGAPWHTAPRGRDLDMLLELELIRGGSIATLPNDPNEPQLRHYPIRVLAQAIVTAAPSVDPGGDPIDGTLTDVWVDGDAGSDLAAGTEDDPVRTLARAIALVTDEEIGAIYLRPSADPYDGAVLGRPLGRRFALELVATGDWREVAPPWTVSADSSTFEIGAPGASWSPNEWLAMGATLEVVSSSDPLLVGSRRTIVQSTADRIWTGISFASMPAGTVVRIVVPRVEVDVSDGLHLGTDTAPLALFGIILNTHSLLTTHVIHGSGLLHGCRLSSPATVLRPTSIVWTGAGWTYRHDGAWERYVGLGLSVAGQLFCLGGNQVAGTFTAHQLAFEHTRLDAHGIGVLGLEDGLWDLQMTTGCSGWFGRNVFSGSPKAPVWLGRRTHITHGSHVDLRTTAHLPEGGEIRVDGSRLSVSSPDRIVTTGTIRAQAGGVVRIQGAPAIASPPGGGYIVGEPSFQVAAPDLDHESLTPAGRLVNPVDGSRIYWAAPEPT